MDEEIDEIQEIYMQWKSLSGQIKKRPTDALKKQRKIIADNYRAIRRYNNQGFCEYEALDFVLGRRQGPLCPHINCHHPPIIYENDSIDDILAMLD